MNLPEKKNSPLKKTFGNQETEADKTSRRSVWTVRRHNVSKMSPQIKPLNTTLDWKPCTKSFLPPRKPL